MDETYYWSIHPKGRDKVLACGSAETKGLAQEAADEWRRKNNCKVPVELKIDTKSGFEDKLPNKLSDLVEVAIGDLKLVVKDSRYKIDPLTWHDFDNSNDVCRVCFAGAVLAKSLKMNHRNTVSIGCDVGIDTFNKLEALNYARTGCWYFAAEELGIELTDDQELFLERMAYYDRYKMIPMQETSKFIEQMEQRVNDLRSVGL